jgi:glycine betaine/proline transport system permease protein
MAIVAAEAPRRTRPLGALRLDHVALAAIAGVLVAGVFVAPDVPGGLDAGLQDAVHRMYDWITANRTSHWLFTGVFDPVSTTIDGSVDGVLWLLRQLGWAGVLALTAAIGVTTGGWRGALGGTLSMAGIGVVGYWDTTMITLAMMLVGIGIALVIGVPLGVWVARSPRADRALRPLLDAAQVMPAFVYLGVLVLMFGIGYPPAVAATVVYAVPPAVRLTAHGLRNVPVVMNEVGESFGCTTRQQLMKVQLPIARRTILLGLNQVIMMAFGIVVIGSLLGTGDTGNEVLNGLQKNDVGLAAQAGLAIVFAAVALDRISTGERHGADPLRALIPGQAARAVVLGGIVAGAALVARVLGSRSFPDALVYDIGPAVDRVVEWTQDNLRTGVPVIGGTKNVSDQLVLHVIEPLREFLSWTPWLVVVAVLAAIGWVSHGWRLALTVAVAFGVIATMGDTPGGAGGRTSIWDHAMSTLSQVLVALVLSVLIAVPVGVLAGRSRVLERMLRPLLDTAQVLPQFVYLVPVLVLFGTGRSAGVIASLVYAIPPCVRLTALGLREVPVTPREAAVSFGATPRQELWKVQLPLAFRSVMLGVNQTVLMVLATVIIAALIGGGALGLVSLGGFQKQQQQIGQGFAAGIAIVCLAVVLDRITQAWGRPRDTR